MKKRTEEVQDNMPYTIIGHTGLPKPKSSILLTADGIFELARRMNHGESVRIEVWEDITKECESLSYYQRITIIKNYE